MPEQWRFEAIGTRWEIETVRPLQPGERARITRLIDQFDREWSRFRSDSIVSRLAVSGGETAAPPDAAAMLDVFRELSAATRGAVNPLIGESLARRGYDASYSFVDTGPIAAPPDWTTALTWDDGLLRLAQPAVIDVGALGKGRLVDLISAAVSSITDGPIVVDASGDLAVRGGPVRIGLEDPRDPRRAVGIWDVTDAALCASAINRRTNSRPAGCFRLAVTDFLLRACTYHHSDVPSCR